METLATGPRVRLRRAEQVERNRQRLLESALQVFRRDGYAGASLDAIAESAGFSKGVVYSQFSSKADLFLTLLEAQIERRAPRSLDDLRRLVRSLGPEGVVRELLAESRRDPLWRLAVLEFRVVAARDPLLNERYRRAHRRTVEGIERAIGAIVETAGFTPDLPLATLAVAALVIDAGGCLEDAAEPGRFGEADAAAVSVRLLGLASTPALRARASPRRRRP